MYSLITTFNLTLNVKWVTCWGGGKGERKDKIFVFIKLLLYLSSLLNLTLTELTQKVYSSIYRLVQVTDFLNLSTFLFIYHVASWFFRSTKMRLNWFSNLSLTVEHLLCTTHLVVVIWSLNCVWLLLTPWTVACQAPLSMGFPRQEYWNGLPFPSPGDLPNPGIKRATPALQLDALLLRQQGSPQGTWLYAFMPNFI